MRPMFALLFVFSVCSWWSPTAQAQSELHFRGRLDGFSDVAISLDCPLGRCTGTLTYLRSKTRFQLSGTRRENTYTLEERDSSGQLTGYLSGTQSGPQLSLRWQNVQEDRSGTLRLLRIKAPREVPTDCGDNKWLVHYRDPEAQLLLQRISADQLRGYWYFLDEYHTIDGRLETDGTARLTLRNDAGDRTGLLLLPAEWEASLTLEYFQTDGRSGKRTLARAAQHPSHCEEYADYFTRYDLVYPKLPVAAFQSWIGALSDSWLRECRRHATVIAAKQPPSPQWRAREQAYAWAEVSYLDEKILSGTLTFTHSWRTASNTVAFNYDLSTGRSLDLYDLIKENNGFEDFLKERIIRAFRARELFRTDAIFREWIEQNSFASFTLRPDGIHFSTEYSQLYGRHHVTLPYKLLKPYLRKDAPVRRWAR